MTTTTPHESANPAASSTNGDSPSRRTSPATTRPWRRAMPRAGTTTPCTACAPRGASASRPICSRNSISRPRTGSRAICGRRLGIPRHCNVSLPNLSPSYVEATSRLRGGGGRDHHVRGRSMLLIPFDCPSQGPSSVSSSPSPPYPAISWAGAARAVTAPHPPVYLHSPFPPPPILHPSSPSPILTNSKGVYLGFGGLLMILGSIGEWIIGNTFPFVVFGTFGAFWLAFACTLIPWFNAYGAYVTDPAEAATSMGNPGNALGLQQPGFFASFAFFLVFMGYVFSWLLLSWTFCWAGAWGADDKRRLVCLIFLVCSLRTNIVFMIIFLTLVCAFSCLAGAYWNLALVYENPTNLAATARAGKLQIVSYTRYPSPHSDRRTVALTHNIWACRQAAPSPSSPPWRDGGSSARSCWRVWISRLVFPWGI